MASFVSHLEGSLDGSRHDHRRLQGTHEGRPLLVRYDLAAAGRALGRADLARRPATLWRYRELLPVERDENVVSLGEGTTPLLPCPRLGAELGLERLWIKDESHLPTGSFKARGLAHAVSRAKELGVRRVAIPTAGNAGGALAAYAARAGLEAFVFMPLDTPVANRGEAALFGAHAFLVDGLITDCAALVQAGTEPMGWFDLSTLKEPYRLEGKKTMGLELAEQLDWRLPDAILYPTGGGTGLVGMAKAFEELEQLGWLEDRTRPRFYACQADGCAPIVRAFERGERFAAEVEQPHTVASGLRVPRAVGDFLILDAVRRSRGTAVAAGEAELLPWMHRASALEGIGLCPESAACLAVLPELLRRGLVKREERVVVFNTGAAQKYVECLPTELPRLAKGERPAWDALRSGRVAALTSRRPGR
jgi:threonine synthase